MKVKLLRYNKEPLEIDIESISRISGVSQSNVIVVLKTGESYTGYMIQFN